MFEMHPARVKPANVQSKTRTIEHSWMVPRLDGFGIWTNREAATNAKTSSFPAAAEQLAGSISSAATGDRHGLHAQ